MAMKRLVNEGPVSAAQNRLGAAKTREKKVAQEIFLSAIANGRTRREAILEAGREVHSVDYWMKNDKPFKARYDEIRAERVRGAEIDNQVPDFPEFCEKYFGQMLFPHQLQWFDMLEGRTPRDLHPMMTYEAGSKSRLIINTPTGHAKSTTITVNYVVWRIVKNPNVKIKVVSKTQRMAEDFLLQIKERLTNPKYILLQTHYAPTGGWSGESASWRANRIYVSSEIRDAEQKDPTCEALGIRGQIYGARADLIILDDCVDNLNANDYEKQIKWIQGMLMNRLGRNGVLLVVGTRIAGQDLYSELMRKHYYGGKQPPWTYLAQKAVLEFKDDPNDWVCLWPKTDYPEDSSLVPDEDGLYLKWDGELLAERRAEVGPTEFARMYQQETVAEDLPFKFESISACQDVRAPGPLSPGMPHCREGGMDGLHVIAGLDPASIGYTAAVVLGVDTQSGLRYVLDVFNKPSVPPQKIKELLYEWTDRFGIDEWRVERNAFQTFLTRDPEVLMNLANRGCVLTEHTTTGQTKHDPNFGVLAMAALFDNGMYRLPNLAHERIRTLADQLSMWQPNPPRGLKTDLVMALWFAEIRAGQLVVRSTAHNSFRTSEFFTPSDIAQQRVIDANRYESEFSLPSYSLAGQYTRP